ncbi:hypothetical protein FPV67DRAFT_1508283 [Lyophyllum atratum]|nr:hypothetical protein FPV67DRAFT_1508283 [Lyophyllum atratum]
MPIFADLEEQERQYFSSMHSSHTFQASASLGSDEEDSENQDPSGMSQGPVTPAPSQDRMNTARGSTVGPRVPFADSPAINQAYNSSFSSSSTTSSLGRRSRDGGNELTEWSPATKVQLVDYAKRVSTQYGVPSDAREEFIAASTLPTHKLVVVVLAKLIGDEQENIGRALQGYCTSTDFKEHVVGRLRSILLDPKLSSYKDGLLSRLLRHIRLNPGLYRIPASLRDSITDMVFSRAVSKALTTARSELKRKMTESWAKKKDIYALVKYLSWNSSQEMSDAIWARFAWLQLKLSDYREEVEKGAREDDKFWNWIDEELKTLREKNPELLEAERKTRISFVFEQSLIKHRELCPAKTKQKASASHQVPAWQVEISNAVDEMEKYSQADLADEEQNERGGESSGEPVEEAAV